jgi:hypothetical protein
VIVSRWLAEKGKVGCGEVESLGVQNVKESSGGGECLNPVGGRHGRLKEQGANYIIYGADNAFSFTILRRSVGAGHA